MSLAYTYDNNNNYSGTHKVQQNPFLSGQFLLPSNSTWVAPPDPTNPKGTSVANKIANWDGSVWTEINDPEWLLSQSLAQKEQFIVFYRNDGIKDTAILQGNLWSEVIAEGGTIPIYMNKLMTDSANAKIAFTIFTDKAAAVGWDAKNINGVFQG